MKMRSPNDGANAGFWRKQLRGNDGKFIKMGGGVVFDISLPGFTGIARGLGFFIGNLTPDIAIIEVRDNKTIPKGRYQIPHKDITGVKAIIPTEESTEAAKQEPTLSDDMLGSEVHKKKLASITKILKSEGRFAVPRQTSSDHWGIDSDVSRGAKADYGKVYESSTLLKSKYSSFDQFWEKVKTLSVNTDSQSPNDLSQIPEEMKEINREYAVHFLGLKPDGLITVYRNAVNNKDSEIDAAAGYVSTDRDLAYDYNSGQPNIATNGRYEIDVKPEEISGMIGYSNAEDEFAFVIGTGVTSQPGRVRRVGDIEKLPFTAPWLAPYEKTIVRSQGATPYRHHALGGQFDFHEVDNFGNNLTEFFQKNKVGPEDIKAKFDQIYGQGSYDEYKESGNSISFGTIKKMFVDLPTGKIGLDITKIPGGYDGHLNQSGYGDTQNPESFKNDLTDNTLKMLAVFQELTGEPFFTHRSRDYTPGTKPPEVEPELVDSSMEPTEAEIAAIKWYTDTGYWEINKHLRDGADLSPEGQEDLETLLAMIDRSELDEPRTVYRGRPIKDTGRLSEIEALKPGDKITDRGIMSTSKNYSRAQFYAQMELDGNVKARVTFEINLPAGQKALPISDSLSSYGASEEEILLPPNTTLEVEDVSVDESGRRHILLKPVSALDEVPPKTLEIPDLKNSRDNYAGTHVPPGPFDDLSVNPLDLEKVMPGIMNREQGPSLYRTGHKLRSDKESFDALYSFTGDPEQEITVYRAVPKGVSNINSGDWVSLSPTYASEHLESVLLGRGSVVAKKVKVSEIYTDGNSINEFAWHDSELTSGKADDGSVATIEKIEEIWDPSKLNELDDDKVSREIYDKVLTSGLSVREIAEANPEFESLSSTFKADPEIVENFAIEAIRNLGREWNGSPSAYGSIQALQQVAKKVFNLEGTSQAEGDTEKAKEYMKNELVYEAFVRATYETTQKFFADRGIKSLVVYRGMINSKDNSDLTEPTEIKAVLRPLSSWSVDPEIGKSYASLYGILMKAEIPVSQVLSTAFSGGLGTQVEREVVLLGAPEKIIGVVGGEYRKLVNLDSDIPGIIDVVDEPSWQAVDGVERLGVKSVFDEALSNTTLDLTKIDGNRQSSEDAEMFSREESTVLKYYTANAYKIWNRELRLKNLADLSRYKADIDKLDQTIENHGEVFEDALVYRGISFTPVADLDGVDWNEITKNLKIGDIISDDAYMSTSNSLKVAYGTFAAGAAAENPDGTYQSNVGGERSSLLWTIKLPKGSKAMGIPDEFGYHQGAEEEVLLPRGSQLRVTSIRRVKKDGSEGRYNYYLETELIGSQRTEIESIPQEEGPNRVEG